MGNGRTRGSSWDVGDPAYRWIEIFGTVRVGVLPQGCGRAAAGEGTLQRTGFSRSGVGPKSGARENGECVTDAIE